MLAKPFLIATTLTAALVATAALAQPLQPAAVADAVKVPAEQLTPETIEAAQKQLDAATGLSVEARQNARDLYQQALQELELARQRTARGAQYDAQTQRAASDLRQLQQELAALPRTVTIDVPADATLVQLDQLLAEREAELVKVRETLAQLEAEPKRRQARRTEIPALVAQARQRLEDIERQRATPTPAEDPPEATVARRTLLEARHRAVTAELVMYEKELAAYSATADLLPVQRDLAAGQAHLADERARKWRELVHQQRQREAEEQARRARIDAAWSHPDLQSMAEENQRLTEQSRLRAEEIAQIDDQLETTNRQLEDVERQFSRTRHKVDTVGLTDAIGLSMRKQRGALPNVSDYQQALDTRAPLLRQLQLELFELDEQRAQLSPAHFTQVVQQFVSELDLLGKGMDQHEAELAVSEILERRKPHLDVLIRDSNNYFDRLVELDEAQRKLIRKTTEFAAYIDERVLWIRSTAPLHWNDFDAARGALAHLLSRDTWAPVVQELGADLRRNPLSWLLGGGLLVPLLYFQRRFRHEVRRIGNRAIRGSSFKFWPTLETLALTVLASLPLPAVLWFLSWRLTAPYDTAPITQALAAALSVTAWVAFPLELLRKICRPDGLAEAHFDWHHQSVRVVRRNLRWFTPLLLPVVLLTVIEHRFDNDVWKASLGRFGFFLYLTLLAVFMHRLLRPGSVVLQHLRDAAQPGLVYRLRRVWYLLGVGAPVLLGVLSAAGYHYTATRLTYCLQSTLWLLAGLLVVGALLLRWLAVTKRRLSLQRARELQHSVTPALAAELGATPSPPVATGPDLTIVGQQTRTMVHLLLGLTALIGVWFIWVDVLPALGILHRVPLWNTMVTVAEDYELPDGAASTRWVERPRTITLANLAVALLMLAVMTLAVKNLPGLVELLVLERLPLEHGARYALVAVSRYAILLVGVILACSELGISWSKVQWLAAAITLGLGFGLQEIFANFVSGLILLAERPVRVGDIVTIDGVTGTISRIRMRATTITNWDRQELIVPNKDFITGRLLNWTLTDPINRVQITVGVAFGSDTDLATQLLRKVAEEHPVVMKDPAPIVSFEAFDDSSLRLVMRCYLPSLEHRLKTIHDLHTRIDKAFRAAGIEVAYPQRDLHLRSTPDGQWQPPGYWGQQPATQASDKGNGAD